MWISTTRRTSGRSATVAVSRGVRNLLSPRALLREHNAVFMFEADGFFTVDLNPSQELKNSAHAERLAMMILWLRGEIRELLDADSVHH
jgi:hypothetical protein